MTKPRTVLYSIASAPRASILACTQMSRADAAQTEMTEFTTRSDTAVSAIVAQPQFSPAASIVLIH